MCNKILFVLLGLIVAWSCPVYAKLSATPVRVALVLGSGGARGYAHVGVIKALEKAGIPIDLIVGASAGSIIGGIYADSRDAAQLEKIMLATNLSSFVDINLLPGHGGLITGYQEQQFLLTHIQARNFKNLKIKFATVATNLVTGDAVTLNQGLLIPAIQASTALPGLVRPVHLQGMTLVDGGAAEPIPVKIAQQYHPQVIIAVDVDEPLTEDLPVSSYGIYNRAQSIIWRSLTAYSEAGANITIRPAVAHVGTFALGQRAELIKAGEKAAQQDLPQILHLLKQKHIALIPDK